MPVPKPFPSFDALLVASYKGASFAFVEVEDEIGRALARHEYPNRPGADIEDLGREPRQITLRAVFYSTELAKRDALIKAIETPGSGTLNHPVWGSITVNCERSRCKHTAQFRDYAEMDLTFIEDSTKDQAFQTATAASATSAAQAAIALATQIAQGFH